MQQQSNNNQSNKRAQQPENQQMMSIDNDQQLVLNRQTCLFDRSNIEGEEKFYSFQVNRMSNVMTKEKENENEKEKEKEDEEKEDKDGNGMQNVVKMQTVAQQKQSRNQGKNNQQPKCGKIVQKQGQQNKQQVKQLQQQKLQQNQQPKNSQHKQQPQQQHEQHEQQQQQQSWQHQYTQLQSISPQTKQTCLQITQSLLLSLQLTPVRSLLEATLSPIYAQFCAYYENILNNTELQESIKGYCQILVKYWNQGLFFEHFVESKYLGLLMGKLREFRFGGDIVRIVFGGLEYLIRGLGEQRHGMGTAGGQAKEEQFIYLLVLIAKEGFVTENYKFRDSQDWAYYAHFMKILVRIINQADKAQEMNIRKSLINQEQRQISQTITFCPQKKQQVNLPTIPLKSLKSTEFQQLYSKYLTIFFNPKVPHFPLLLKLLYFYKWPDAILQTSVKLCLLQISNHPNRKLQKYLLNFPFVTFYILYCTKISQNIQKYLTASSSHSCTQKPTQKQQSLLQQIISDIKFLEDYLKIQHQQPTPLSLSPSPSPEPPSPSPSQFKTAHIPQHLNMYINTFYYYIGKGIYQQYTKYIQQQNINGLINGILVLIKIMSINTIVKIRIGFQEMLHKYINCQLWEYLRSKRERMDQRYWVFQYCEQAVREHAATVIFGDGGQGGGDGQVDGRDSRDSKDYSYSIRFSEDKRNQPKSQMVELLNAPVSKSTLNTSPGPKSKKQSSYTSLIFKAVKSYIPITNSNWLYYQMKKISQILGLEVQLNKQIQHSGFSKQVKNCSYFKNSFIFHIDKIQQNHLNGNNNLILQSKKSLISRFASPIKSNPLFTSIFNFANKGGIKHSNSGSGSGSKNGEKQGNGNGSGSGKRGYQDGSQELIYYYLILLCCLKDPSQNKNQMHKKISSSESNINLQQINQLIKIAKKCRSLMLVGMLYWYIKLIDYQLTESNNDFQIPSYSFQPSSPTPSSSLCSQQKLSSQLLQIYIESLSKLVYYILTQGWQSFINHLKQIKKIIWKEQYGYVDANMDKQTRFSNDVFRDVQCDIVFFVMLRHMFGTPNARDGNRGMDGDGDGDMDEKGWDGDGISKEIRVPCRLTNSQGDQVYMIMDGQYIQFIGIDDVLITKKPLLVSSFNVFYQDEGHNEKKQNSSGKNIIKSQLKSQLKQKQRNKKAVFELVDSRNMDGQCFTVFFDEIPIREYVAREIKERKRLTLNIEMSLRTMRFDIQH